MAALQIKNIPTGPGDDIKIDASWAKGDTKNVISTSAASPNFLMMGGTTGQFGPSNSCWRRCDHGCCLYTEGWLWCLRPRG